LKYPLSALFQVVILSEASQSHREAQSKDPDEFKQPQLLKSFAELFNPCPDH